MKLLDSNIVIYSAEPEHSELQQLIEEQDTAVSIATYIEVLGFRELDERRKQFLRISSSLLRYSISLLKLRIKQSS